MVLILWIFRYFNGERWSYRIR